MKTDEARKELKRDRAANNPGGCECLSCGCIFIGEEWHTLCAVCYDDGLRAMQLVFRVLQAKPQGKQARPRPRPKKGP
jgi:hypothetical protein